MGGHKWCPKDCVYQETIGAWNLSPANVTTANAALWPASAFSLVTFVSV